MLNPSSAPLQRILGTSTTWLIGMGVAIGSGIFRSHGNVAATLQAPWLIVIAWLFGGAFVLAAGLVTAELATRFPRAGSEYVFLKEAYGDRVAFFFGWCYTVFILGGGAALIALALGDFSCELLRLEAHWSGRLAAAAIVAMATVNAFGLRAGAGAQNALTLIKTAALVAIIVIGFGWGPRSLEFFAQPPEASGWGLIGLFSAGVIPVLWSYDGTTDSAKMAEEITDVRRSLPRALIGAAATLTVLYVGFNLALMRLMPAAEMAGREFVPGEAMSRLFGETGRKVMLLTAILVCLSALTATLLAPIRVTFALARDGLAFRFLSRMSAQQAPVAALALVAAFGVVVVLNRRFTQALEIYYFASAILFGLAYASLIVFRVRERRNAETNDAGAFFRCPAGPVLAVVLILVQVANAVGIAMNNPRDAVLATLVLAGVAVLYEVWRIAARRGSSAG